jgi:ABC-type transport system involved in multi-copper enzyme maturation permease subunit
MSDATTPAATAPTAALAASANAARTRHDFPGWLPPMLVKELRQGLRQRGFVGGLIAAQAVLVILFISGFATEVGDGSGARRMIDGIFWSTLFATLLIMAPLRALGALSTEMDARTMDLLLLTRLDAWRIVWGKWVSLMTQTLLLVVALLPYAVVRYFFGSVNIAQDLVTIAAMVAAGGVCTGVGLWASGMNRIIRYLIVVGVLIFSFGAITSMMSPWGFRRMFGVGHSSVWETVGVFALLGWIGACVLAYSLLMATRWFAPVAENHAIGPRLIPLALLLPAPVLAMWNQDGAETYFAFWLIATAVVAAIEFAGGRELLAIHLRGRLGRVRLLGDAFLPGWPSAALWAAGLAVLAVAGLAAGNWLFARTYPMATLSWLAVLAWAGLVFPALLVSFVPSLGRMSAALYFVMHAVLGLFGVMAGSTSLGRKAPAIMQVLDWVSHAMPTTSFWHALNEVTTPSELPAVEFGQAVGVALTLALMLWAAKPYWTNVRAMRTAATRREPGDA